MDEIAAQLDDMMAGSSYPTPGAMLRQARTSLGLSQKEVATQIRITVYKLDGLETDHYEKVGADTFIRGYLRSYAKIVELNCDDIIKAYDDYLEALNATSSKVVVDQAQSTNAPLSSVSSQPWFKPGAVVVSLALVWIVGFSVLDSKPDQDSKPGRSSKPDQSFPSGEDSETGGGLSSNASRAVISGEGQNQYLVDTEQATAAEILTELRGQAGVLGEQSEELGAAASIGSGSSTSSVTGNSEVLNSQLNNPQGAQVAENTLAVAQTAENAVGVAVGDRLVLTFLDQSWVQISNKTGVVFEGIKNSGEQVILVEQAPFEVMLGNAEGVNIEFNGKTIESNPIGSRKTRRLNIGA